MTLLAGQLAAAATTWSAAAPLTLPTGATAVAQGYLPGLACPSVGNCVAVGQYVDSSTNYYGLVATETGGTWRAPQTLAPPANATPGYGVSPLSVACSSAGNCAVVGDYYDTSNNVQAFYTLESSGSWGTSTEVTLPAGALGAGQVAWLRSVACPPGGTCVAVGSYTTLSGATVGLVVTLGSTPRIATPAAPAAAAAANPFEELSEVACSSAVCTAVGTFLDQDNVSRAVAYEITSSGAGAATVLTMPGNVSAWAGATVGGEACPATGACVVVGTYMSTAGKRLAYSVSQSGGAWRRAVALRLPSGARPLAYFYGFGDLSCASAGNCAAGGQYRDASGHYQGFLANEVAGSWQPATELTLPAGASSSGANGGVVAVSCVTAQHCSAGAAYLDGTGNYQALLLSESGYGWGGASKVNLPGAATTVGTYGGIYGLACASSGCTAVGSFLDPSGAYQGFTVSGH
jgi:hypothetical protein